MNTFSLADIPLEFWLWAVMTVLITASVGFTAGICFVRFSDRWALQRAKRQVTQLVKIAMQRIESAQEICSLLEKSKSLLMSANQAEQLENKRSRLLESISGILDRQHALIEAAKPKPKPKLKKPSAPTELTWQREPLVTESGLPDRNAFEANLRMLLAVADEADIESGLLFIRVDKLGQLEQRYGVEGARQFQRQMAALICRSIRDEDLLCQYGDDTLTVLAPGVDSESGARLATALRNTIRHHRFLLDAGGPEVFVTASFGYTTCMPGDQFDLVMNRAGNALANSQRRGRNQLFVCDGEQVVHCAAS